MMFNQTTDYIKVWRKAKASKADPNITSHYTQHYGKNGQCICMCGRCWSDKKGCICKECSGAGHWACEYAEFKHNDPVTGNVV